MTYQADLICNGEPVASRNGNDSNQLLAWVLTQLESKPAQDYLIGIIKNTADIHEKPCVFTVHNAHFD